MWVRNMGLELDGWDGMEKGWDRMEKGWDGMGQ